MSAPTLGVPIGSANRERGTASFDHVPKLWELLPNGGWPGVVYAQVCVHNLAHAAERDEPPGRMSPIRGTVYYEITGPRGAAQMALMGVGRPIPGASPEAGARLFFTDGEVERLTGHPVEFPIWFRPQPADEAGKPASEVKHAEVQSASGTGARAGEGGEGAGGVQARNPALRQQRGSEGTKP